MTDAAPMQEATARMMTLARTTPGYPTAMPVSPTMAPMLPMAPHHNDTSADHPAFPFVGHDFFSWLA